VIAGAALAALAGCQAPDPTAAKGEKADEKKEYTAQDAQAAQPVRSRTSDSGE
jgi:hypothetical protein